MIRCHFNIAGTTSSDISVQLFYVGSEGYRGFLLDFSGEKAQTEFSLLVFSSLRALGI